MYTVCKKLQIKTIRKWEKSNFCIRLIFSPLFVYVRLEFRSYHELYWSGDHTYTFQVLFRLQRTIVNSTLTGSRALLQNFYQERRTELNLIKFDLVLKEQERKRQTKNVICILWFSICIFNKTYLHVYSSLI